jgi:hypothetical protein
MILKGTIIGLTLGTAMAFGAAAVAADPPKEGTYKVVYTAAGMIKPVVVGKDRVLLVESDEHGLTVGEGILDRMTWQCWGMGDYTKGYGHDHGYCVGTDLAGDQLVDDWILADHPLDQTTFKITDKFTGGTGKYVGISGGGMSTVDSGFHSPAGSYTVRIEMQGTYKLP